MLPSILRIGPLVFLEFCLNTCAIGLYLDGSFPMCYIYMLIQLSIAIFLTECIISIRMILTSKKLRKQYLCKMIFYGKLKLLLVMIWNQVNMLLVFVLTYYCIIADGMTLKYLSTAKYPAQCQFTLYPLCFYHSSFGGSQPLELETILLGFLYFCYILTISVLLFLAFRQWYIYYDKIIHNRKIVEKNRINLYQSLIDSNIVQNYIETIHNDVCSICLRGYDSQKIIKLQCGHIFHYDCILEWLTVRDNCPYRCGLIQN